MSQNCGLVFLMVSWKKRLSDGSQWVVFDPLHVLV